MALIPALDDAEATPDARAILDAIAAEHGRVTNMKRTLHRLPVVLHAQMTWYDLRAEGVPFLGERSDRALRLTRTCPPRNLTISN